MTTELKCIIKKNPLRHLDLSGCLKTAAQVRGAVKKMAKHITLLAAHLSQTPVIHKDKRVRAYIRRKLRLVPPPVLPDRSGSQSYPNTLAGRKLDRTLRYFAAQKTSFDPDPHYIVQRTLAHPENIDNGQWHEAEECYDCGRHLLCICPGTETVAQILERAEKPPPHRIAKLKALTPHCIADLDPNAKAKLKVCYVPPPLVNEARLVPLPTFALRKTSVLEIPFDHARSVFAGWQKDT